ncbi:MAG TPA: FUSC family protein [Chthoniobacter sp.]|jgi:uncharacterized membrane protein YccC
MSATSAFATDSQCFDELSSSLGRSSVREEFVFTPTRLKTAFKLALACSVAMTLGFVFNWDYVYLAMVLPILFNRQDTRFDLRQLHVTVIGAACIGTLYYLCLNLSQNPIVFGLVLGGLLVTTGAMSTIPIFGPCIAIAQAMTSAVLVVYFYRLGPPQNVFFALTMVHLVGYLTVLTVNYLLWPYSPRQEWDERLGQVTRRCRRAYAEWFAQPGGDGGRLQRPNRLDRQVFRLLELLDTLQPADAADPGVELRARATAQVQEIAILLQDLRRAGRQMAGQSLPPAFADLGAEIDRRFQYLEDLLANRASMNPASPGSLEAAVHAAADALPEPKVAAMIRQDFLILGAALETSPEVFGAIGQLPAAEKLCRRRQSLVWTPPFHPRMLLQLNAASFHHGIKVAFIVLACLMFWQAFRWPAGATIVISGLTVALPVAGLAMRQAFLRVVGMLLGLACAYACIVLVIARADSILGYGLCVFCFLFALGCLSAQSLRVGYVGISALITFVFILIFTDRQTIDLEPLRERFVALVAGVLLGDAILLNLWPVRQVNGFFASLSKNFATCARGWSVFRSGSAELERRYRALVSEFNREMVKTGRLALAVEFEGGEGGSRYGFAARMFIHEIALFEQMRLLSVERIAGRGGRLPTSRVELISEGFAALARRLCHPVEGDLVPGGMLPSEPAQPNEILDRRAREVEQILDSMDRLTSLPHNPVAEHGDNAMPRGTELSPPPDGPPRFENGVVPEAAAKPRGFLIFGLVAFIVVSLVLFKALSGDTPFLLVGGIYFPAWFSACVVGAALAFVTLLALRSHPLTRAAGIALVFFNLSVIYGFLAWHFLFS